MSTKYPKLERLQELLTGDEKPTTNGENYLLIAYERSKIGDTLLNLMEKFPTDYEKLTELQKDMFVLGYALGQKYYLEKEMTQMFKNKDKH